ncbi:hypothetical protein SAMN02927937_01185 [Paenimyroides aquimaris]|uniref:Uncharacterized protein n=1 Tax=Paenimyroides marinum TaxID=1159016 RepID=A0A1H6KPB2_9FLAO|nr:hypothetical protein [Paenimyroides aquimaris]SEH74695.1 hypothetical protein SAMN02927937_01185 [Paenimyroides aquimaris]
MRFLCIAFILIFTSCTKEKVRLQEDFVFTSGGDARIKSFKFINDTVFVASEYPKSENVHYFLLTDEQKNKINIFLDSINKRSYKSEYIQEGLQDGGSYQFEFLNKKRTIYVYGFNGSYEIEELNYINKFATFLEELYESKMRWDLNNQVYYQGQEVYWNKDVDFGDLERFIVPDIPYDAIH